MIVKRKLKRNKKTGERKFLYEIIGKLEYNYDFSSLHDYVFMEKEDDEINSDIKSLKNHLINLDQYFFNENENNFKGNVNINNEKLEEQENKLSLMLDEHVDNLVERYFIFFLNYFF